jgi:hypothetical protein
MPQLRFFAARSDLQALIEFLLGETDVRIFELSSELDHELREFRTFDELCACYDVGIDSHGNTTAAHLFLWSPSAMSGLNVRRIELDQRRCKGHTFRYAVGAWGGMQLYLGGVHDLEITPTYFGHSPESETLTGGALDVANWGLVSKLSARIRFQIRTRLAAYHVAIHGEDYPVLREAYSLAQTGLALRVGPDKHYLNRYITRAADEFL